MAPGRFLRPFGVPLVEAPTAIQAAEFDRNAIQDRQVPESALMENAGRQAALVIQHIFPKGPVVALIGAGNNGRDALVCIRALSAWGRRVRGLLVADRPMTDSVLHGWAIDLEAAPSDPTKLTRLIGSDAVVVDGILGTGTRGPPRARQAAAIEGLNASVSQVVSLDNPSGVDGSTGAVPGSAVRADLTVAFGSPKLGTLLHPARSHAGRIISVEIGFPPRDGPKWARLITPGWAGEHLPQRPPVTHKNAVGSLCLVAGSEMPGAAILAARSAFRAGVGLVRVCGTSSGRDAVVAGCPEVVYVDAESPGAVLKAVSTSDAVAVGPGLGTGSDAHQQFEEVLAGREHRPLVLDADALTLVAGGSCGGWSAVGEGPVLITPHPGEMGRIAGMDVGDVQASRVETAFQVAASRRCVALLKGAPSLVASPDGDLLVDTQGSSDLAVAGMGDVLTGAAGALLAQGLDSFTAAGVALHVTGQGARSLARGASLTPSDVVEAMAGVMKETGPGHTDLPFPFVTFDQDAWS